MDAVDELLAECERTDGRMGDIERIDFKIRLELAADKVKEYGLPVTVEGFTMFLGLVPPSARKHLPESPIKAVVEVLDQMS